MFIETRAYICKAAGSHPGIRLNFVRLACTKRQSEETVDLETGNKNVNTSFWTAGRLGRGEVE